MKDREKPIKILSGVARGYEPHVIQQLWHMSGEKPPLRTLYITETEEHSAQLVQQLSFVLKDILILSMPSWDCLDIFPIGEENPVRLDFFGDVIEGIRVFDAFSQTTLYKATTVRLKPSSEICLTSETMSTFRQKYRSLFGSTSTPLYQTISE